MKSNGTTKRILALLLAAAAGSVVACGGDDDRSSDEPSASQTQTSASPTTTSDGAPSDRDRAGDSPSGGTSSDGTSSKSGSGGSHAPRTRTRRAPRKKSLERYLAKNYRQTPWYPLMRKLKIDGGHVTVYLTFSPESDDESPPVLACTAILSYGRRVKNVTVYGSATPQGQSVPIKAC